MKLGEFIILQIIAHLLADFIFQSEKGADDKNRLGFRSKFLINHIFIVFVLSWIASLQLNFVWGAASISVLHGLIDGFKSKFYSKSGLFKKYLFFIDQALHILCLLVVVIAFSELFVFDPVFEFAGNQRELMIAAAYLFCAKPYNIVLKEILNLFDINFSSKTHEKDKELQNAGKLIGIIERWLVLTFVIVNKYEAVGFLLAAKSILRYKDIETIRTEYVLIGTMLSFGIAIAMGIGIGILS